MYQERLFLDNCGKYFEFLIHITYQQYLNHKQDCTQKRETNKVQHYNREILY